MPIRLNPRFAGRSTASFYNESTVLERARFEKGKLL